MGWVDNNNQQFTNLLEIEFKKLNSFHCRHYYFKFGEMSEFDRTSILMRLQRYNNQNLFDPFDFVDFLLIRKIPFRLFFIPTIKENLKSNLFHLKVIVKLNIYSKGLGKHGTYRKYSIWRR